MVGGRNAGADTAISGTAWLSWEPAIAMGWRNVAAGRVCSLVNVLASADEARVGTGELLLIWAIRADRKLLLRCPNC